MLATGTPVVLVLLTGRPYALGPDADAAAAVVQAFFPGQQGGAGARRGAHRRGQPVRPAAGRACRATPAASPATYLAPPLGRRTEVSSVDPTPAFPFGHGLSLHDVRVDRRAPAATEWPTDGDA